VLEGRFGALRLDNESRIDDGRVRAHLDDVVSGAPVQELKLERSLLLLADLEGAGAPRAILRPGAEVGQTDLALRLDPEPMLRGSVGYDNGGNTFTGRDRLRAGVDVVSPFGWGDVLSFEGLKEFAGTDFANIRYELPIGSDGLWLHGGYSRLEYDLGKEFAPLDANGDADTWRAGIGYPLLRSRRFNVYTTADFEYSDLQDRIDATATVTDRYYFFVSVGISGDFRDDLFGGGVNVFSLRWTPGELDIETPAAAAIDDATLNTDGVFQRWNLQFLRLQRLTDSMSLYLSLTTQKADGNLDSSQKLVVGGPYGVRAFEPGEASGDSGYVFAGELRYDFDLPSVPGSLQAAGFVDCAHITINEDPFVPGDNHRNLSAVGASLTWQEAGNFFVKGVFAHRIGGGESRSDPGDDAQIWLEAVKYF